MKGLTLIGASPDLGGAHGLGCAHGCRKKDMSHGDKLWSGYIAFSEDDFADKTRFPKISRTTKSDRGRKGLSGGRLRMGSDGIHWEAGSLMTPGSEIAGSFLIPWSIVTGMEVNRIPYNLPIGGALTIRLRGGSLLYGESLMTFA